MERVKWIVILLLLLNAFDGLMTVIGLQMRVIQEANPMMQAVFHFSPALFLILKVIVVSIAILLLYKIGRRHTWIAPVLVYFALMYLGIGLLHIRWLSRLW